MTRVFLLTRMDMGWERIQREGLRRDARFFAIRSGTCVVAILFLRWKRISKRPRPRASLLSLGDVEEDVLVMLPILDQPEPSTRTPDTSGHLLPHHVR